MSQKIIRNVVIKDGNRTVNWDFKANSSVRDILLDRGFEWETGSVKVCGKPVTDEDLSFMLYGFVFWGGNPVITLVPKKKELPVQNKTQKEGI